MKTLPFNVSYSAINSFYNCKRNFYYNYIQKYPEEEEKQGAYSAAGSVVHKVLEETYTKSDIESKQLFDELWTKYKLDSTNLGFNGKQLNKVDYWNAVLNGKLKMYQFTSYEEKFEQVREFGDVQVNLKGFVDGLIIKDNNVKIIDWKTNNVDENQIKQMHYYAYLYYLKHKVIPTSFVLEYIKHNKQLIGIFKQQDLEEVDAKIYKFVSDVTACTDFKHWTPNLEGCAFCAHKKRCANDNTNKEEEHFQLLIKNGKVAIVNQTSEHFSKVFTQFFSYEIENKDFVLMALKKKGIIWDGIKRLAKHNTVPMTFLPQVRHIIQQYEEFYKKRITISIEDCREKFTPIPELPKNPNNTLQLRWYQQEAVDKALKEKIGVLEVATSGGKTVIAAEIYRRDPRNTLFIVDRNILLEQTKKEFSDYLGIPLEDISEISEGKMNIKSTICVATIQTLAARIKDKNKDMIRFLKNIHRVIIDECHGAKNDSFDMLIKKVVNADSIIGLTGTLGLGKADDLELHKNVGYKIYEINAKQLIEEDTIMKPTIIFKTYDKPFIMNGTYNEVYSQMLLSETRNKVVIDLIQSYNQKLILVIVQRIEHGELLQKLLTEKNIDSFFIQGSVSNDDREKVLDAAKAGNTTVLIGTSSIVSKGMSLKPLTVVINTTANATSIMTIQALGRVLRKNDGKTEAIFYDLYDTLPEVVNHTLERIEAFKKEGHEVIIE